MKKTAILITIILAFTLSCVAQEQTTSTHLKFKNGISTDSVESYDGSGVFIEGTGFLDDIITLRDGSTQVLKFTHNATNAVIEPQAGYGLWIPIPSGERVGIGPSTAASTFLTIDDNNTSGFTNVLDIMTGSSSGLTMENAGAIYMQQLGSDDTEDHVIAIDDGTGLLTKRSVASIEAALQDSSWIRAQADTLYLRNSNNTLYATTGDPTVFLTVNGLTSAYFGTGSATGGNIGVGRIDFDLGTVETIEVDVSNNLSFKDGVTGTKTLAELAAGGNAYDITTQSGSTYTLVLADAGTLIKLTYTGAITITVPLNSSVPFPIGTRIRIAKQGTGGNANVNGSGAVDVISTFSSPAVEHEGTGEIIKTDTDEWMFTGDIVTDA